MIRQRPAAAAAVVRGVAENLPFARQAFDAALAVLTVNHWASARAGLAELRRVARRQVVLTWDPEIFAGFWLVRDYLPQIAAHGEPSPAWPWPNANWPAAAVGW
jgi:ubiquinone/menaquinone biosynthesis C-methylase UbiE